MSDPLPEVNPKTEAARRIQPLVVLWIALDAVLVCVFGAIGKSSHESSAWAFFDAAWPFLVGLALGWLAVAWLRRPGRALVPGVLILVVTVVVGAVLRVVSGSGGAPLSFLLVTTAVLAVLLLGWRLIAAVVVRLRG